MVKHYPYFLFVPFQIHAQFAKSIRNEKHSNSVVDMIPMTQVLFQHAARHAPLRIEDLVASIQSNPSVENPQAPDVEMDG